MKIYIYKEADYQFRFSFNKEQLINYIENEIYWEDDNELKEIISEIGELEIEFPECSWIITNYNEWSGDYILERFAKTTEELKNIDLSEYDCPELHQINEYGYIDNEPFIFIQ